MSERESSTDLEADPTAEDFGVPEDVMIECGKAVARRIQELGIAEFMNDLDPETKAFYLDMFKGPKELVVFFTKFLDE